jgi:hypothetical protein
MMQQHKKWQLASNLKVENRLFKKTPQNCVVECFRPLQPKLQVIKCVQLPSSENGNGVQMRSAVA